MNPRRVAVLAGGVSLERDVSLRSGRRVAEALETAGHEVGLIDLDDQLVRTLTTDPVDVAVLTLHGRTGEDGTVQGLLELIDLPFTGSDALASSLAWDKTMFKGLAHRAGITTPPWVSLSADAIRDLGAGSALDRIGERLGLPLVVKPAQGGASMGVRYVDDTTELAAAVLASFSYHDVVLVERFIEGTEVAVSVVDDHTLPAVEIVPKSGAYDFSARYTHGATEFFAPARLDPATLTRCQEIALSATALVGCRHISRADLIVDPQGVPWILELDTCPGMTETSLVPMAAEAAGWSFTELCRRIVELAASDTTSIST